MPAITNAAILVPTIAANALFSGRRAKKGVDNMEENPVFGIMNLDIAAAQILKGFRAAKAISMIANGTSDNIKNEAIKHSNFAKKILNFTSDHINGVIWAAGAAKVLFGNDEDKLEAAGREGLAIGTMRLCEEGYKIATNMPVLKKCDNGTYIAEECKGHKFLREHIFKGNQLSAKEEFKSVKKIVEEIPKSVRGGAKGVCFVMASIGGYILGTKIADGIFGKKEKLCAQEAIAN